MTTSNETPGPLPIYGKDWSRKQIINSHTSAACEWQLRGASVSEGARRHVGHPGLTGTLIIEYQQRAQHAYQMARWYCDAVERAKNKEETP